MWETRPYLEGGLPAGLERQGQSQRPSKQDQAPTYIYRDCSCQIRIQCDDWRLEIRRGCQNGSQLGNWKIRETRGDLEELKRVEWNFTYQNRKESRRGGSQSIAGSSVFGREYLR